MSIHILRFLAEDAAKNYILANNDPAVPVLLYSEIAAIGAEVSRPYIGILGTRAVKSVPDANNDDPAANNRTVTLTVSVNTAAEDVIDQTTQQVTTKSRQRHIDLVGIVADLMNATDLPDQLNKQGISGIEFQNCEYVDEQAMDGANGYTTEITYTLDCLPVEITAGGQ